MVKNGIRALAAAMLATVPARPGLAADPAQRPGVGQADHRVAVDVLRPPWNSLVRVQTELGGRCTGFVVAPQVVVTAAHCLFLFRVGRFIQPGSVHVLLSYRMGQYAAHARVARFTIPSDYRPLDESGSAGLDRAVLLLEHRLPGAAILPIEPVPGSLPLPVRLGGYGQDRDEVAIADPACRLTGYATDGQGRPLLTHDCEATRGTSGAPLLWQRPDGRWAAVAIQIEAVSAGAGGRAVPLAGLSTPSGTSAGR